MGSSISSTKRSTLGKRGQTLTSGVLTRDLLDKFDLNNQFDPIHNPDGFINIGVAENLGRAQYAMMSNAAHFVNDKVTFPAKDLSYGEGPWGSLQLREAMARHISRRFNAHTPVNAADVLFACGVTSLCEMLGFVICDPGEAVLYSRPIYQAFEADFRLKAQNHHFEKSLTHGMTGVKSVYIDVGDNDQFKPDVVTNYEKAIQKANKNGVTIRALLLCNPHNPLRRCYPKETIIELMKFCNKHKIHLLSDEIYAMSVYKVPDDKDAVDFTSVLSFDSTPYIDRDYLHVLYGLSKDFAAGGLRLGCTVTHNKELMRGMSAITESHYPSSMSFTVALAMLEDEAWLDSFFQKAQANLSAQCQLMKQILDDAGISYARGANAGFFLWVDLRPFLPISENKDDPWEGEKALASTFMKSNVFVIAGQGLRSEEPGWFRFIFSAEEQTIRAGMGRIMKILGKQI